MNNRALKILALVEDAYGNLSPSPPPQPAVLQAGASGLPDVITRSEDPRMDSEYDPQQLEAGTQVEMEHTDDIEKAKSIAKDHLDENPNYYTMMSSIDQDALNAELFASSDHSLV